MAAISQEDGSEVRAILRALGTPLNLVVLGVLLGIGISMSVRSAWTFNVEGSPWWESFLQNFSTEMYGAFLTFLLIEVLVSDRQRREATRRAAKTEKSALILQMGSPDNAFAVEAVRQLRARGWLTDGSLQGANLFEANLQKSSLLVANLQGARLVGTNLQGANLSGANLQWAYLADAEFSEDTWLPVGTRWTPDTDMARFTDPKHPDFWRSPAYRGDDAEDDDNGEDDDNDE